jgi:5'-3' exonuclease
VGNWQSAWQEGDCSILALLCDFPSLRKQAEADLAAAKESGAQEDVDKYSRRLVKVTKQHNDDCKELLRLMGVPVITAPCEAGLCSSFIPVME